MNSKRLPHESGELSHTENTREKKIVYGYIESRIRSETVPGTPYVVGIDGVSGAGKSNFTDGIARYLAAEGFKIELVHIDDFHNPRAVRYHSADQAQDFYELNVDFEMLVSKILEPIRKDKQLHARMTLLDLQKDTYTNTREFHIDPDTVVIVEGIFILKEQFRHYFNLRIFLDVQFDTALSRGVARNNETMIHTKFKPEEIEEKFRDKYLKGQEIYNQKHSPKETADIVVLNDDHQKPKIVEKQGEK